MTQEDRFLLLKSLCAYLPYGLKCDKDGEVYDLVSVEIPQGFVRIKKMVNYLPVITTRSILREDVVKPYLCPMSSMTEKEKSKLRQWGCLCMNLDDSVQDIGVYGAIHSTPVIDYLNSIYVDYRGLIPMGLALKAPEGMYNDMGPAEEFKYVKKTEELPEGYIYVPWIPNTTKALINGIQVWDSRWWKNILCKINWFLHFKRRKAHKKYVNININEVFNISKILEE